MSYIVDSLSKDEEIQALFYYHWFVWVPIAIKMITIILIPFGIYDIFVLKTTEFGLTNKRVIVKKGIISRNSEEMSLKALETVEIRQGIMGRIFGYGKVKITGRGGNLFEFEMIDNPLFVKRCIESNL